MRETYEKVVVGTEKYGGRLNSDLDIVISVNHRILRIVGNGPKHIGDE